MLLVIYGIFPSRFFIVILSISVVTLWKKLRSDMELLPYIVKLNWKIIWIRTSKGWYARLHVVLTLLLLLLLLIRSGPPDRIVAGAAGAPIYYVVFLSCTCTVNNTMHAYYVRIIRHPIVNVYHCVRYFYCKNVCILISTTAHSPYHVDDKLNRKRMYIKRTIDIKNLALN